MSSAAKSRLLSFLNLAGDSLTASQDFFFLFNFLDIRLISHICLISHMPDADRWINNQIKKEEKEDIKS
jgi:hypothetical protein